MKLKSNVKEYESPSRNGNVFKQLYSVTAADVT